VYHRAFAGPATLEAYEPCQWKNSKAAPKRHFSLKSASPPQIGISSMGQKFTQKFHNINVLQSTFGLSNRHCQAKTCSSHRFLRIGARRFAFRGIIVDG
jgi:hypothetical protein